MPISLAESKAKLLTVSRYVNAVRSLLRVPTYLLMLLYYTVAFIGAGGAGGAWNYALGALAIAAWYVNATSLNDLSDYEIDQVNLPGDPDRPLVAGVLNRPHLQVIALSSGVLALVLVAIFGWLALGLMAALVALNAAYSLPPVVISRRGGLALALLPIGYVVLTMGLGSLAAGRIPGGWLAALIALSYVQFVARISLKDYRDVTGDAQFGKRTFLLRHGSPAVVRLALGCHLAAGLAGAALLYPTSPARAAGYVFLGTVAASMLMRLHTATAWPAQRVWISAYGRLVSGQLVVILLEVLVRSGAVQGNVRQYFLLGLIVATFAWSTLMVVRRQNNPSARIIS